MLSRVAHSIYWLNRYVERVENYARFIDVNLNLTLESASEFSEQWSPLVLTTGDAERFELTYKEYSRKNVIKYLTYDLSNPNSILSCLAQARENARTIREVISRDMWEQINELYLTVQDAVKRDDLDQIDLGDFYAHIKMGSHSFCGVTDATLNHGESWYFGNLGRYIERADKTARILDMKYFYLLPSVNDVGSPVDLMQWSALLKSASAFQMYRQEYGRLEIPNIIRFLVFNRDFPRSIKYCLTEGQRSLHAISNTPLTQYSNTAERELGKLLSQLSYTDVHDILQFGLHEFMDSIQLKLNNVGDEIFSTFFATKV